MGEGEERDWGKQRTDLADQRTRLAHQRTEWAQRRTILARERTFSAWVRTGLGLAHCKSEFVLENALPRQPLIVLERGLARHARSSFCS